MDRIKNEASKEGEIIGKENVTPLMYEDNIKIEYLSAPPKDISEIHNSPRKGVIVSEGEFKDDDTQVFMTDIEVEETIECKIDDNIPLSEDDRQSPQITETTCEICNSLGVRTVLNHQQSRVCTKCLLSYLPNVVLQKQQLPIDEKPGFKCTICSKKYFPKYRLNRHMKSHRPKTFFEKKLFECYLCDYAPRQFYCLKLHMRTHTGIKNFSCEVCSKRFALKGSLKKHRQVHIDKEQNIKRHKCNICGFATHHDSNLRRHMKIHTGVKIVAKFKCKTCDKNFTDKGYLKKHQIQHLDENEKPKFNCNICEYFTPLKSSLKVHMVMHDDKKFECNVCAKRFFRKPNLISHQLNHTDDKPFKCNICSKEYQSSSGLAYHKLTNHVNKPLRKRTYECYICKYANSYSAYSLRIHFQSHSNIRAFRCSICPKSFKTNNCRSTHEKLHSGQRYECRICLKKLSSRPSLRQHLDTHLNGSQRIKKFKCDICDAAYYGKSQLKQHKITHFKQEGSFTCDKCFKEFTKARALNYHLRMHINYPFDCHYCKRHFSNEYKRECHENEHHKIAKFGRRTYECYVCKSSIKIRSALEAHMRKHTGDRPFRCEVCSKGFYCKSTLNIHGRVHWDQKEREKLKIHRCYLCKYVSSKKENLEIHVSRHITGPFECNICSKMCKTEGILSYHQRKHTGLHRRKYVCYICKLVCWDVTGLRQHMRKHTGEKPFHCDICDKYFKQRSILKHHRNTHLDKKELEKLKKFKCQICRYATRNSHNLKRHMFTHTGGERAFPCTKCPMKFPTKAQCNSHMETHLDDAQRIKKHKCHLCGYASASSGNLKRHLNKHVEKSFACDKCPKKYSTKDSLQNHLRAHIETPHFCTQCNRKFAQKTDLKEHLRNHRRAKFSCKLCSKKFTLNDSLKRHMRAHSGAKPFSCTICSGKFVDKSSLNRHLQTHNDKSKDRTYECYLCQYDANVLYKIKQHMVQHYLQ